MRRILLVMVLLLLSSCHLKQDETFVNPVFYGKMESLNDLWDVTITPTTFDMDNRHGATWHEDCEMWKNEPDEVVLRCTHQLNKEQWGYLWNHFQMTGLPMYLIIDKKGNIAKQFTHVTAKELKKLLELEVNR